MLAFGLGFEFPLLLVFLQILGIVTTRCWQSSAGSHWWASSSWSR